MAVIKAQELREKNVQQLQEELIKLRGEQFNLRMRTAVKASHEKKIVRRLIARIKTVLLEKGLHV